MQRKRSQGLAKITEEAGFDGIFSPEVPPYNAITNAQVFAECTERVNVGTWIANIYMRQPVVATATALTIQEITDGRMILGLGVSHKPVNNRYDIDMGNPIEAMRSYVGEVRAFADGTSPRLSLKRKVPDLPVHIAGLTKAAAELAGEVADGIMPYLCPPAYIATLKEHVAAGAAKAERDPQLYQLQTAFRPLSRMMEPRPSPQPKEGSVHTPGSLFTRDS